VLFELEVLFATLSHMLTQSAVNIKERVSEILEVKSMKLRPNTLQQLAKKLNTFVEQLADLGVTESDEIKMSHVIALTKKFPKADITKVLRTRTLRFFLKRMHRPDLVSELEVPSKTKEGNARRKPRPYTDAEIKEFCAVAQPRVELFFRTSIATGLSVRDLVQLRPENLRDRCVRTHRQKTGKEIIVPIAPALYEQLRVALPFYAGDPVSGVAVWSLNIRVTAQKAGIWIRGANVHRGRDTFVEKQIAAGVPLGVVAARIGDNITTLQTHYSDLLSPRLLELNMSAPCVEV
jgi:integrase